MAPRNPALPTQRYIWGRRFGRLWLVHSWTTARGAKVGEMVVRAWTKGGARRLAERRLIPETWSVYKVERHRA